jgi:hypothetical protein
MKLRITLLVLALFAVVLPSHAQNINAAIGATPCTKVSSPLDCYRVPVTLAGDTNPSGLFEIDTFLTGYKANTGSIYWAGSLATLGQSTVDKNLATYTTVTSVVSGKTFTANLPTTLTTVFHGVGYSGAMIINMGYVYGGSGRSAGWYYSITGGTLAIQTSPAAPASGNLALSGPVGNVVYCGGTTGYYKVGIASGPYKYCDYYGSYNGPHIAIGWREYFELLFGWDDIGN